MSDRKLTTFTFFYNTPLVDFSNTIHFKNNEERDEFFKNHYKKIQIKQKFNWIKDKSTVNLPIDYWKLQGVNYCTFLSEFEENRRYYAYVIDYSYINDKVTQVELLLDPIMTFTQGNILTNIPNIEVIRQHLSYKMYRENIDYLKNNDDVLKTFTKRYFYSDTVSFDGFYCLIYSTVSLNGNFGNVNNPNIDTSTGSRVDFITSPVNLYLTEEGNFTRLMDELKGYPWITQNFKKVILIPKVFITNDMVYKVKIKGFGQIDYLYKLKNNAVSTGEKAEKLFVPLNLSMNDLYKLYGLNAVQEKHLLRNEYATFEIYTYDGQNLNIDLGKLDENTGIKFRVEDIVGYDNEIRVHLENYKADTTNYILDRPGAGFEHVNPNIDGKYRQGSYFNDSIYFKNWDTIPVLVDTGRLNLSKNANLRRYAESNLITNEAKRVIQPNNTLKDRFFAAASIISNLNPRKLFGRFSDEYEYYRQLKAKTADLALEAPTISNQSTGNSFNIKNDIFGITIKLSKASKSEMDKIRKYYGAFGYQFEKQNTSLDKIDSMNIANYVQFKGSWYLPNENIDVALNEMMKAQFENGVRLWHNNGTDNPMTQDLSQNKRIH